MFLLMLIENVVPPIPSELIMPLAGFASSRGAMPWLGAVVGGTAGSVLGAWAWYELGRRVGRDRFERWVSRHGRWLAMTPQEFRRADGWLQRWGPLTLALGRCVPGLRGIICIPAGVARMKRWVFALACTAGSGAWCLLLVEAGRLLGRRYDQVSGWLGPVSGLVIAGCIGVYLLRVIRHPKS